ncbi:MAG: glycoside hydrolase family 127 protein [Bacteroidetes bacterium]|nr:glycoside hydrolase family 127 protein [Bacteroidota bacterium]
MNRSRYYLLLLNYVVAIIFMLLFTHASFAQHTGNKVINNLMSSEEWHFSGHLGQYLDKIAEERILKRDSWNVIYPETEEAFRLREDDKNYPKTGQWRGEFWGKYILSAIAACRYYHSDELKSRIATAVKGLLSTQDDNGYIGTYAHSDFLEGNNWNVWNRKYTLWGLIESWELLGDRAILTSAVRFADHLISEVGPGSKDIVRTGNFYGMPSSSILQPMVKLYIATGQRKYLEYTEYIVRQWSEHPEGLPDILNKGLSGAPVHSWFPQVDPYQWGKGYEFTSCVEGLVELYKVTGKQQYFEAAKNIHAALVKWERTPIGSVSFNDKYVGSAGLINTVSEICDAVYWNRLSFELFKLTGDEKYIDEIERTLYNSLLCAFNREGTWGLRRLRMSHTHIPAQNHFLQHHQCCTDNLPRGLFQAAEAALCISNGNVYLSLFSEGEGSVDLTSGRKIRLKIEGDFLSKSFVKATLSTDGSEQFSLFIRTPHWSKQTSVKVNGTAQKGEISENWMKINRIWKNGDVIDISFDLAVRWEAFDTTKSASLFHKIDFYDNEWAKMKFMDGSNKDNNRRYEHVKSLSTDDALPQKPAVTFFYGPIALARDVRITGTDVFFPVKVPMDAGVISIRPIQAPPGIWKAFELDLGEGKSIKFCDFSSAGNTWSKDSQFNTWCIVKSE